MDEGNAFFGRATFEKIIFPGQTVSLLLNLVSLRWSFLDRKKKGIQQVTESLDFSADRESPINILVIVWHIGGYVMYW